MPKVLSYTPAWLCRPSPGFDLFQPNTPGKLAATAAENAQDAEPTRTIARRGTEIFVAVGNEIRWSDLILLKEDWEAQIGVDFDMDRNDSSDVERRYRLLKVPVSRRIKHLVASPTGDYLVIVTSHTVHVAVLPDPSHLTAQDTSPIKPKCFQLGPTTHVLERSAIASVLWHPLGVDGSCLVTVTTDAVVRLWELDRENRWSFDSPSLAIDLKRLADGRSTGEDFTPSKYGSNRVFSPDSFEMEVAAACFGGSDEIGEDGWASSTLWVGMRQGDVYAVCPLLPSRFQMKSSTTASLASDIEALEDQPVSSTARRSKRQQSLWIHELQLQQRAELPTLAVPNQMDVFSRPVHLGAVPKLQGPFRYAPDAEQLFDITDIFVIGAGTVLNANLSPELEAEEPYLPMNFVCVATGDSHINIFLDSGGVEAAWLPSKRTSLMVDEDDDELPELLWVECLKLDSAKEGSWPVFTPDALSRHAFFVAHSLGVSYVSIASWAKRLAEEMDGAVDSGTEFRLQLALDNAKTVLERPIRLSHPPQETDSASASITACVNLMDSDLGYFLLMSANAQPQVAVLDDEIYERLGDEDNVEDSLYDHQAQALAQESRPSYQPPAELWAKTSLSNFIQQNVHGRHLRAMKDEIRLSPLTFNLMMDVHRILSEETHRLGLAAADLFTRCERMQDEFRDQLIRVGEAANRTDSVLEDDVDAYDDTTEQILGVNENIEKRLIEANARQENLLARHAELRRRLSRFHGTPLSKKERAWSSEIDGLAEQLDVPTVEDVSDRAKEASRLQERFTELESLTESVVTESKAQASATTESGDEAERTQMLPERSNGVGRTQIELMLERQTALVQALVGKVGRLKDTSVV